MQSQPFTELESLLRSDEATGIEFFRAVFNQALNDRRFTDCRALLHILQAQPSRHAQQTKQHYQAVLLFMAERRFDEAERLWRDLLAQELEPLQQARTALALAVQLHELGQWDAAAALYQNAVTGYQAAGNRLGLARVYNNLGIMHSFQMEQGLAPSQSLGDALTYHQKALALLAELEQQPATQEEMAKNWHGIARVYALQGMYTQATAAFTELLVRCQRDEAAYNRAVGLADLAALVLQPQGQIDAAQQALAQAITLLSQEGDELHLAETWTRLGNLLAQQHDLKQAHSAYATAIKHTESLRNRLTAATTQLNYRATTDFIYNAPLTLHLQQQEGAAALTAAERARARVLADLLAGQNPLPHKPLPAALLARREELRRQLEQSYSTSQPLEEAAQRAVANLAAALSTLDRQIELLDSEFGSLHQVDALTATQICAQLAEDAILLAYVSDQAHHLHLLVATRQGVRCQPLDARLTTHWLQGILADYIEGKRQGLVPDNEGRLGRLTIFPQLYDALLAPVWEQLQQAKTIYIIPTGPLNYLPLGALMPQGAAAPPLLATGRRVVYAPSATVLFRYCLGRTPSARQGMLAIAPTDETLHLTQGAAATLGNQPASTSLQALAANRTAFLAQSAGYRIVCFLGHALFNPQHPMLSYLKLSDGQLQASEILRELRLNADLVVLAACETGRSQILRGDEILGLSRALLYAGTPALLVTAWKVHELSTRLFLEYFFTHLQETEAAQQRFDPAGALAAAQNWLRNLTYAEAYAWMARWPDVAAVEIEPQLQQLWTMQQQTTPRHRESKLFSHPFFWAPYLLIGEPAPSTVVKISRAK